MNANELNQQQRIVLKDGKSTIAEWISNTGEAATVGDYLDLPEDVCRDHPEYGTRARVVRIEVGSMRETHIEVESESGVAKGTRPVVTLNASLVPENIRPLVEEQVRALIDLPLIEWEDSFETSPVLRLHQFTDPSLQTSLPALQLKIRQILGTNLAATAG